MSRLILVLIGLLLLIPQPTVAMQGDDTELRFIEAEDPIVQQQGAWTLIDDTDNTSGVGYLVSSGEPDDELGLLFEGTQIEVVYLSGPDFGTFHIEVDNEIVQSVDAASDEPQFGVGAVVEDLDSGFHIIRVIADSGAIAVDGFEITPSEETKLAQVLPARSIRDEDEIFKNLHSNGVAWAIISFQLPFEFVFETRLEVDQRTRQRANIALIQDTILQELSEFEVTALRRSVMFPDMTLVITNVDAFLRLKELPYVTSIRQPGIGTLQQNDDTEIHFIEAEDPLVQQQGEWTLIEDPDNASGEGYLISSGEADDELGLLFEGTQIEVVYLSGPDYGTFHIEVDNEIAQTIDAASEELQFGVRTVVEDLESGFHIIRVIAQDGVVAVDGFEITPSDEVALQEILANRRIVDLQEMLCDVEAYGMISVIIGFLVPPVYILPYRLNDEAQKEQQQKNINLVAGTIVSELGVHVITVRRWPSISPYLGLHVDEEGLQLLANLPYVTFLKAEEILTPAQADSGNSVSPSQIGGCQ